MLNVYVDESCRDSSRYLILGGIAVEHRHAQMVCEELRRQRELFHFENEVKWSKVSRSQIPFYKAYTDAYFELAQADVLQFHALHVDTSTFNHQLWNAGSSDLGFSKLVFQLLLHKFGRRYGPYYRLYVYLDKRTTRHPPESLRPMLNNALAKYWDVVVNPFRRLTFQDSKGSEILQLNDLLIGAIGFRKNGRHRLPNSSPAKIELAEHIAMQARRLEYPTIANGGRATRFTLWPFEFRK